MTNQTTVNLAFNKSAAARLLNVAVTAIARLEEWANCVFIHIKGKRPTFLSKALFAAEFVRFRREGAKACQVRPLGAGCYKAHYEVKSAERFYMVRLSQTLQNCECIDYEQQLATLGKGFCKHMQAVVDFLGYTSLDAAVLGSQADAAKASIYPEDRTWPTAKPPIAASDIKPNGKYRHVSII